MQHTPPGPDTSRDAPIDKEWEPATLPATAPSSVPPLPVHPAYEWELGSDPDGALVLTLYSEIAGASVALDDDLLDAIADALGTSLDDDEDPDGTSVHHVASRPDGVLGAVASVSGWSYANRLWSSSDPLERLGAAVLLAAAVLVLLIFGR